MVLILFRSRLAPEAGDDYHAMAEEMVATAREMPGFVDYTFYAGENGERLSVVRWENLETMKAWREHPRHKIAQAAGRDRWYQSYDIEIAEVIRTSTFNRSGSAKA